MTNTPRTILFPLSMLSLSALLATIMVMRSPDMAFLFVFSAVMLPACWVFFEIVKFQFPMADDSSDHRRIIRRSIGYAGLMIAASLGLSVLFTTQSGWVSDDIEQRATGLVFAVILVAVGNVMPKTPVPLSEAEGIPSRRQAQLRLSGLSMLLTGLAYGLIWAIAPISLAHILSKIALVGGMVIMMILIIRKASRRS